MKLKDRKIVQVLQATFAGENKVGKIVHGVLDILPIPNQPLGKLIKAILNGEWQQTKEEIKAAFTLRNVVAIILTVAFVMGWITPEQVKQFTEILEGLL